MPNPETLAWLASLPPNSVVVMEGSEPERVLTQEQVDAEFPPGQRADAPDSERAAGGGVVCGRG